MRQVIAHSIMEPLEDRQLFSHATPDLVGVYKGTTTGKTVGTFTIRVTGQSSRNAVYGTVTDVLEGVSYTDNLSGRVSGDSIDFAFSGHATGTLIGVVTSRHGVFTLSGQFTNQTLDSSGTFKVSN